MAEAQPLLRRIGLTRGKAGLIAVLAVLLVGVIYIQYGRSQDDGAVSQSAVEPLRPHMPTSSSENVSAAAVTEQQTQAEAESALAVAFDPSRWKSPDLASIVAYDPFALPESFPQPPQVEADPRVAMNGDTDAAASADAQQLADAIEQLQMELEVLKQRGVQVIVHGRDKYVAWIGDRMVHVGDDVDGFTVTDIDTDGVRVERKVDQ